MIFKYIHIYIYIYTRLGTYLNIIALHEYFMVIHD